MMSEVIKVDPRSLSMSYVAESSTNERELDEHVTGFWLLLDAFVEW
jgi:hypothetical protein